MPTLTLNGQTLTVPEGATILQAARTRGIAIPTLCHRADLVPTGGCRICVVEDLVSGRLLPACATPAADGAQLAADTPLVRQARHDVLELLLSDHPADCVAPCELACPSHLHIPRLLRALASGEADTAAHVVYETIALPRTLSRVCPAPCEKACRRATLDHTLDICWLKGFAAGQGAPPLPRAPGHTGRRVTIIGAGPAGLAAAFFIQRHGHACTVLEMTDAPGGQLRRALPPDRQPLPELAADVAVLQALGVRFHLNCRVGHDRSLAAIAAEADAIVLATGEATVAELAGSFALERAGSHIRTGRHSFQTSRPHIFAVGAAAHSCRLAVLANAQAHRLAASLHTWLVSGQAPDAAPHLRFRAHAGHLAREQLAAFGERGQPGHPGARTAGEAATEAARCLHCDCRKADDCRLRDLCEEYGGHSGTLPGARRALDRTATAAGIVVESARCVACGICVRLAAQRGASVAPALVGRGFELRIAPPLGRTWDDIPAELLQACAQACPTGALARA